LREEFALHIFGGGPLQSEVDRKCQGLTNTFFRGQVSEEDAVKYIGQSRLVLVPSRWFEGLPLVMQESFAMGTPLLVSNVGPLASLVERKGGDCFAIDAWEEAHTKIETVLKNNEVWMNHHEEGLNNFQNNYTPLKNREQAIRIYKSCT